MTPLILRLMILEVGSAMQDRAVVDELEVARLEHHLQHNVGMIGDGHKGTERGFLLDGFPRTVPQAEGLARILDERGKKLDHVLVLDAADEELVMRIAGRRTCESCQATYHVVAKPPKVAGVCDRCGGTLIQRSDDSEEIIRNRLREYNAKTRPVLDYFEKAKWPVRRIDATGNMDQIFGRIYAAVLLS